MTNYLRYIGRVLAHKWFVARAGWACGVNPLRLLIHDWSKFTPAEMGPYTRKFFGKYPTAKEDARATMLAGAGGGRTQEQVEAEFQAAFLHHLHLNPHHWQYWCKIEPGENNTAGRPTGTVEPVKMPEKYAREMVADWWAAGRAYDGEWRLPDWYAENAHKIVLHPETRDFVERLIDNTTAILLASKIRYRLDVHYPMELFNDGYDQKITDAVGFESESSGGGIGGRDLQFYFASKGARQLACNRIGLLNDPEIRVVRREDLDGPEV